MAYDRDELFSSIKDHLVSVFEVPEEKISLTSTLESLDLDSIDAVDLMVKIQDMTGKKVSSDQFKKIRTIEDVLNVVGELES